MGLIVGKIYQNFVRGSIPPPAFLHEWLRAAHVAWLPAVPCVDRAGVDAADVRCEEHDVFRL